MDEAPALKFQLISNGGRKAFPYHAKEICFLDGHPDLLHIGKRTKKKAESVRVWAYRKGWDSWECKVFETNSPTEDNWDWYCHGNAISFTHYEANTGTAIIYENRSFRAEKAIAAQDGFIRFIRAADSDYFQYNTGIIVKSSNLLQTSMRWRTLPGCLDFMVRIVGKYIVICHLFNESTTVMVHELDNGSYRERGQTSVPFKTSVVSSLGVFDCHRVVAAMFWTFYVLPENIVRLATRFAGDDTMEIYFSTTVIGQCFIYKTSLPLQVLEKGFESQRLEKTVESQQMSEESGEQGRTEYESLERYAVRDAEEKAEMKEKIAALETALVQEKKETKESIENLQASMETLERKYKTILLALSKK